MEDKSNMAERGEEHVALRIEYIPAQLQLELFHLSFQPTVLLFLLLVSSLPLFGRQLFVDADYVLDGLSPENNSDRQLQAS